MLSNSFNLFLSSRIVLSAVRRHLDTLSNVASPSPQLSIQFHCLPVLPSTEHSCMNAVQPVSLPFYNNNHLSSSFQMHVSFFPSQTSAECPLLSLHISINTLVMIRYSKKTEAFLHLPSFLSELSAELLLKGPTHQFWFLAHTSKTHLTFTHDPVLKLLPCF